MENLRFTRLTAAWVLLGFVGLSELNAFFDWIVGLRTMSPLNAVSNSYPPSGIMVFLPILAVVLTALVPPRTAYARPMAMVAYVQYAFMLIWDALVFADQVVRRLTPRVDDFGLPSQGVSLGILITLAGLALLSGVGALACWQIYTALDPLAAEIAELEEQIDELRYEDGKPTAAVENMAAESTDRP